MKITISRIKTYKLLVYLELNFLNGSVCVILTPITIFMFFKYTLLARGGGTVGGL